MARYQTTNSRQAIIVAAAEEFLAKGFAGARTTEIARKAKVTHAMLHYYFQTKEELFRAFIEDKTALLAESISALFCDQCDNIFERIERGASTYFDFLRTHSELPLFVLREIVAGSEAAGQMRAVVQPAIEINASHLQRLLDEAAARGEIRPTRAIDLISRIISLGLSGVMGGSMVGWLFEEQSPRKNDKEWIQESITLIINSIKPL